MPVHLVPFSHHQSVAVSQSGVGLDHFANQGLERDLGFPAEPGPNAACIAQQGVDFGGPKVARIDAYDHAATVTVNARVILRDTKVSPRRGDSWLKRMPLHAYRPYASR